jgi:spectinomycin phosphotransferase
MQTPPNFSNEHIVDCLHDSYRLHVTEISFLPVGAGFNIAVYRVATRDVTSYFFKLRRGDFEEVLVKVPAFLLMCEIFSLCVLRNRSDGYVCGFAHFLSL